MRKIGADGDSFLRGVDHVVFIVDIFHEVSNLVATFTILPAAIMNTH
jgi:hypothetical protein